jgi:hypothetical protein
VEGRVRIIEAGHKTQNVYYVTDGAVWATERELLARSEVGGLPLEYVWTGLRARG